MSFHHGMLFLVLCTVSSAVTANPFFTTFNQGGFARSFLLPAVGQAEVHAGPAEHRLTLDQTSEYAAQSTPTEALLADGETTRLQYRYQRKIADHWDMTVDIPVLTQGGGFLDGFTQDWHDAFHLPNGGREKAPSNRYRYQVSRAGNVVFRQERTGTVLGDVRLATGWQASPGLALRAAIQLPTGSRSRFTGGNAGLAVWGDYALPFKAASNWQAFVSLGGSVAQESEVLPELQRRVVGIGGAGLAYRWSAPLRFILQTSLHTPLYENTTLEALKRPGAQTSFGFQYELSSGMSLQIGLQEDLITASSPDFSVHFALAAH